MDKSVSTLCTIVRKVIPCKLLRREAIEVLNERRMPKEATAISDKNGTWKGEALAVLDKTRTREEALTVLDKTGTWKEALAVLDKTGTWKEALAVLVKTGTWKEALAVLDKTGTWKEALAVLDKTGTWKEALAVLDKTGTCERGGPHNVAYKGNMEKRPSRYRIKEHGKSPLQYRSKDEDEKRTTT